MTVETAKNRQTLKSSQLCLKVLMCKNIDHAKCTDFYRILNPPNSIKGNLEINNLINLS